MDRRKLLEQAFRKHGISDPALLESYILGCDLTLPVTEQTLPPGAVLDISVRNGGVTGIYASPEGEDPRTLGIRIEKRHREVYRVRTPLPIVRCTAATFAEGTVDEVGGAGGGTQYILPPDWKNAVERIQ
jgi:hypothetical protein